jgi:hypothetical protein
MHADHESFKPAYGCAIRTGIRKSFVATISDAVNPAQCDADVTTYGTAYTTSNAATDWTADWKAV